MDKISIFVLLVIVGIFAAITNITLVNWLISWLIK